MNENLTPVVHDTKREASQSTAGTLYHVWRGILAWLELADEDKLFFEGAEDIDELRRGVVTLVQLRLTVESVSLNNAKILQAINHYWEHRTRNPSLPIHYRYSTIAGIAKEQNNPFESDRPGLELWAAVRTSEEFESTVRAISRRLAEDSRLSENLRHFLRTASPNEIREKLILPVEFDTWSDDIQQIQLDVRHRVIRYGRAHGVEPVFAEKAIPSLVERVLEALVNPQNRRLMFVDFEDEFSRAVSTPMMPNRLILGTTQDGTRLLVGFEEILQPLGRLLSRYYPREKLVDELRAIHTQGTLAYIVASSGKGKTQLATDFAARGAARWMSIDLRGADAAGAGRILRAARTQILAMEHVPNLLIDDLNPDGDTKAVARALADLASICSDAARKIVVTSYSAPDRIVRDAIGQPIFVVSVPNFDEGEIAEILRERGAPKDVTSTLARATFLQTSGHPTLVDVQCESLRARGFPKPSPEELLSTPKAIVDERERIRHLIGTLPQHERSLLYRASLVMRPILRQCLLHAAAAPISPDGPIPHAGTVLDRLIGPWLDLDGEEKRLRTSPLLDRVAIEATDPAWVIEAHRVLARALLSVMPIDARDGAEALLHALFSNDQFSMRLILTGLYRERDEQRMATLAIIAPWLPAIGIDVAPIPALQDVTTCSLLRTIQYRVAMATRDPEAANRVFDQFESEMLAAGDDSMTLSLRAVMYGEVLVSRFEPVSTIIRRANQFVELAALIEHSGDADVLDVIDEVSGLKRGEDLLGFVSPAAFYAVSNRTDLDVVTAECEARGDDFARRFNIWLAEETVVWRGIAATLANSERDAEVPNFAALVQTLRRFASMVEKVGLVELAIDVLASAAVIFAEYAMDVPAADEQLDDAQSRFGPTLRLRRTRAIVRHAAGDWANALNLFQETFLESQPPQNELATDMRLAASDAANLAQFDVASALLQRAAETLVSEAQPTMPSALLLDSAFAAWRNGDDETSLDRTFAALGMLQQVAISPGDSRFQNTARRMLYVLLMMSERKGTDVRPGDPLPATGFVSSPEALPGEAQHIPIALLYATAGLFEQRVRGTSSIVMDHLSSMSEAGGPAAAMAIHFQLSRAASEGSPEALMDALPDLKRVNSNLEAAFGKRVQADTLAQFYLSLALIAYSGDNVITASFLAELWEYANSAGFPTIADWLKRGVRLAADPKEAVNVLKTGGNDLLISAIVVASLRNAHCGWLFFAQQTQVVHLLADPSPNFMIDILLRSACKSLERAIDRPELFPPDRAEQRAALHEALQTEGDPRRRLLTIFIAAQEATGVPLHAPVEAFLRGES